MLQGACLGFSVGQRVLHGTFGEGVVVGIKGNNQAAVRFDDGVVRSGSLGKLSTSSPGPIVSPLPVPVVQEVVVSSLKSLAEQREIKNYRVDELCRGWDWGEYAPIVLSHRANGSIGVVDGQHRVVSALRLGISRLQAIVYRGLSPQQEAKLSAGIGDTRPRGSLRDHRDRVAAGDPVARSVEYCVAKLGFEFVGPGSKGVVGGIKAIKAVYRLHNAYGPSHLIAVLSLIDDAWWRSAGSVNEDTLAAISTILRAGAKNLDRKRLLRVVGAHTHKAWVFEVEEDRRYRQSRKMMLRDMLAILFRERYNHHLSEDSERYIPLI